jgi:hypothetical protein
LDSVRPAIGLVAYWAVAVQHFALPEAIEQERAGS